MKNNNKKFNHIINNCFPYRESKCNPRWPHSVIITREVLDGNPWGDESHKEIVIYDGSCRSYRKSSKSYRSDVLTNVRMLSIKGFITNLKVNDKVSVDRNGYKEEGYIKDINHYMNGRGMTIEWDYEKV